MVRKYKVKARIYGHRIFDEEYLANSPKEAKQYFIITHAEEISIHDNLTIFDVIEFE